MGGAKRRWGMKVKLKPMSEAPLDTDILIYLSKDKPFIGHIKGYDVVSDSGEITEEFFVYIGDMWGSHHSTIDLIEQDTSYLNIEGVYSDERKACVGWTELPEVDE